MILSNIAPIEKMKLDTQVNLQKVHKELLLEEQVSLFSKVGLVGLAEFIKRLFQLEDGFNVTNFTKNHDLLKMTFVRHPLDRQVFFRLLFKQKNACTSSQYYLYLIWQNNKDLIAR